MNNRNLNQEQLMRIGKVCMAYYNQPDIYYSQKDYESWLDSLEEPMKSGFRKNGFENCKGVLGFRRFVLELNDIGISAYLKQQLSEEDFKYWMESGRE